MGNNKKKSPYGKYIMALITLLFVAGLIAPSVTGYVNNASYDSDRDKDMQIAIVLENVVFRLVRNGDITLSKGLTSDLVEEKVTGFMGSIPELSQKDNSLFLNITNGKVFARKSKEANEIVINNLIGD
jgi:hypothetical protein